MKLLVFLAKGFETIEFSGFIDVMGWAKTDFGCDVEVVTGGFNEKKSSVLLIFPFWWIRRLMRYPLMNMMLLPSPEVLRFSAFMKKLMKRSF